MTAIDPRPTTPARPIYVGGDDARDKATTALPMGAQVAHVDWGATLAGAFVATAIASVMTTFGAGIGLSATSVAPGRGWSAAGMLMATALWLVWISISSFAAGAYITARMRRLSADASAHERDIRDGVHGLLVWALGAILLAYLATSTVGGLVNAAASTGVGQELASTAAPVANPLATAVDHLLRRSNGATPVNDASFRDEVMRDLSSTFADGAIAPEDRSYMGAEISKRYGVTAQEADKRIDEAIAQLDSAKESARQAAETARKAGILAGFLTAATLLIGAAAAWWAASVGGNHRDEQLDLRHLTSWR